MKRKEFFAGMKAGMPVCVGYFSVSFGFGAIKRMHAVGQPPFTGGFCKLDFSPMQILKDAKIPYSRLHDVGGAFGSNRYIDIPNIFRDFDADINDPESYDFAFTDELIKALVQYGVEPYFRLGVTIENQCHIKAYRIHPPKDYDKWAKICEHIIRHYNEGWANGFRFGIRYWEIWNEPENREDPKKNQMWTGTAEQYYELYNVTAKHLKNCFGDKIKVGGYGACGFYGIFSDPEKYGLNIAKRQEERYSSTKEQYRINFFLGFLEYIKAHNSPIDFFSWHTYGTVDVISAEADFVEKALSKYGYGHIESHLNEWNLSHDVKKNVATSIFADGENVNRVLPPQPTVRTDLDIGARKARNQNGFGLFLYEFSQLNSIEILRTKRLLGGLELNNSTILGGEIIILKCFR